jgi:DNA-binding PadR family transcriptional regulator
LRRLAKDHHMQKMKEADYKLLSDIAEYRQLTFSQLVEIAGQHSQTIWRRCDRLREQGYLESEKREYGASRGRPEEVISISEKGFALLRQKSLVPASVKFDDADQITSCNHQLMMNWFRIQLNAIPLIQPRIKVKFLSHNSPAMPIDENGHKIITAMIPKDDSGKVFKFTPDAAFYLCDEVTGRAMLFFLEVDAGTETMVSPNMDVRDIRQKILNYGMYFATLGYKKYEQFWNTNFTGFRLLFLTNSLVRLSSLCKLVVEMPPSDFVWLTELSRIFSEGLDTAIWARGGHLESASHSILGSLAVKTAR